MSRRVQQPTEELEAGVQLESSWMEALLVNILFFMKVLVTSLIIMHSIFFFGIYIQSTIKKSEIEIPENPGERLWNQGINSPCKRLTDRSVVMSAIRHLKNPRGSSFADIEKYVCSEHSRNYNQSDLKRLKLYMTNAVDNGVLVKTDSMYTIKATAKPKGMSSRSKSPAKGVRKTTAGLISDKPTSKGVGKSPTKSTAKPRAKSTAKARAKSTAKARAKTTAKARAKTTAKVRTKS